MKVLHLTLKKKWFDMIASGEKTEEYREMKAYWYDRLMYDTGEGFHEVVEFRHGYAKDAPRMRFAIDDITETTGRAEWGAEPGVEYFVIKLGERIS